MKERTAIDTIKGYFYQFDFAIVKLLELDQDKDTIVIEGIEDVDINTATEETAIQCKYYAKTEYNHSVIAKPIRQMLDHYKEVRNGTKSRINYRLYGHYQSGQNKLKLPIDSAFLKDNFLTYTSEKVINYHHIELALGDADLNDFLSLLTIDISAIDYQAQILNALNLLSKQFNCNAFEAEHFYYNNALNVIKGIAVEDDVTKREISKLDFLTKIDFKRVLFNEWFIRYKGENKLFTELRNQYFTNLNISPFERFFIIEIPTVHYLRSELKDLLFSISRKWSKLSPRELSPICPYIYLHNISQTELLELKNELNLEGFTFIDGFDFEGAAFNPKSISRAVKSNNPIKLKMLNKLEFIDITISEISKTKEVYQFYINSPCYNTSNTSIKQVKIQISKIIDIKKII